MMSEPWIHMLRQMEPKYDLYKDIVEHHRLSCIVDLNPLINGKWEIYIRDEWNLGSVEFDEIINWAAEQLTSWTNCHRVSWDKWQFKTQEDAEKFKTLCILKWAQ